MKSAGNKFRRVSGVFAILLIAYSLRHVSVGVDLWDSGYNYANFTYGGLQYMDSMWYYATRLANAAGSFLTRLPWGSTMRGMNVLTSLTAGMTAAASWYFCVKKLRMNMLLTFAGEILALSLCLIPSAALYNYLTYALLLTGTLFLYQGLVSDRGGYLVAAGIILGLNVGVRFSNLVQAGLILAVWYYAFISKKKFSRVMKETGLCVLGYAAAYGLFLAAMAAGHGLGEYAAGIRRLFAMTEYATDYSASSMLEGMVWAYYDSSYWVKRFGLAAVCALACCAVFPGRFRRAKQLTSCLITAALFTWLLKKGYCTRDYATYNAVYYPCIIVFELTIGLIVLELTDGRADGKRKLLALLVLLTMLLTTLGSNNAMYSCINNLFFVMPCSLEMARRFLKERKHILFFPFKTILAGSILLLAAQGVRFGLGFVYEEATGARDMGTVITEVPVLRGMRTGAEKARTLTGLYEYLRENELGGRECILYGNIPGTAYYMELAPAMNVWGDLRSYAPQVMREDLLKIEREIAEGGEKPLVILEDACREYVETGNEERLPEEETFRVKLKYVAEFLNKYDYISDYSDGKYAVYR